MKLTVFLLALTTSVVVAQEKKTRPSDKHAAAPQAVSTKDAPPAAGPYSQAIKAGEFVFVAGQVPRDPATNKVIEGDITAQTDRVLKNVAAILAAAGTSMNHVVRTTVFLKNVSDFAKMNEVYTTYFKTNPPARTTQADGPCARRRTSLGFPGNLYAEEECMPDEKATHAQAQLQLQLYDLRREAKLRPGNVHSAEGWEEVLLPEIKRWQERLILTLLRIKSMTQMVAFERCEQHEGHPPSRFGSPLVRPCAGRSTTG